jgi:Na+-driven multidrug efflux pump
MTDQKESRILWLMALVVGAVSSALAFSAPWPLNLFYALFGLGLVAVAGLMVWRLRHRRDLRHRRAGHR